MRGNVFFSIGHSTHSSEEFTSLLHQHHINAVADVRSSPFSRFNPQFNKNTLASTLKGEGIEYLFFGKELGARVDDPSCYIDGKVQYSRLAARQEFKDAITKLIKAAAENRIALMCAEKEPLDCHRTILVSQALASAGHEVNHIHADGTIETHGETLKRLMQMTGVPDDDLFQTTDELIQAALAKQEDKIAYRQGPDKGRKGA